MVGLMGACEEGGGDGGDGGWAALCMVREMRWNRDTEGQIVQ